MPAMRFTKKPVTIEAFQYDEDNAQDVLTWINSFDHLSGARISNVLLQGEPTVVLIIPTLEGTMYSVPGDWIIRGVKGEFYPCKPDIFEATYENNDFIGQ